MLPLVLVQVIGAFLGMLVYVGSKQYRSLFRPQYEAVVQGRNLPFRLWGASEPLECCFQTVYGFGATHKRLSD